MLGDIAECPDGEATAAAEEEEEARHKEVLQEVLSHFPPPRTRAALPSGRTSAALSVVQEEEGSGTASSESATAKAAAFLDALHAAPDRSSAGASEGSGRRRPSPYAPPLPARSPPSSRRSSSSGAGSGSANHADLELQAGNGSGSASANVNGIGSGNRGRIDKRSSLPLPPFSEPIAAARQAHLESLQDDEKLAALRPVVVTVPEAAHVGAKTCADAGEVQGDDLGEVVGDHALLLEDVNDDVASSSAGDSGGSDRIGTMTTKKKRKRKASATPTMAQRLAAHEAEVDALVDKLHVRLRRAMNALTALLVLVWFTLMVQAAREKDAAADLAAPPPLGSGDGDGGDGGLGLGSGFPMRCSMASGKVGTTLCELAGDGERLGGAGGGGAGAWWSCGAACCSLRARGGDGAESDFALLDCETLRPRAGMEGCESAFRARRDGLSHAARALAAHAQLLALAGEGVCPYPVGAVALVPGARPAEQVAAAGEAGAAGAADVALVPGVGVPRLVWLEDGAVRDLGSNLFLGDAAGLPSRELPAFAPRRVSWRRVGLGGIALAARPATLLCVSPTGLVVFGNGDGACDFRMLAFD